MPRKSAKPTASGSSRGSSKRAAPATPSRQSKRAKSATTRSYAEPESDDNDGNLSAAQSDQDAGSQSEYEAESTAELSARSNPDEVDSEDDSNATKATSRGRTAKRSVLPIHKKKRGDVELWKSGAKLELGTQVIIKKPKAREAGETPYTDDTIHPNTMLFLSDLAAHNDRQWLKGKLVTCTGTLCTSILL